MRKKNNCKKYAQAITDYVLGEETDVPKEELMTHLKECAKCHKELTNWQDFQTALRVKEYHSRPEVKEKWDRFFKELTQAPLSGEREPVDVRLEQGLAAGTIYQCLKQNGELALPVLREKTGLKEYHLQQGLGWLGCQEKITMSKDGFTAYVRLQPGV